MNIRLSSVMAGGFMGLLFLNLMLLAFHRISDDNAFGLAGISIIGLFAIL